MNRKKRYESAIASHYIHWLREYQDKDLDTIYVPYNRESCETQNKNHKLHEYVIRKICRIRELTLFKDFFSETRNGRILQNNDRPELLKAVRTAQALRREGKDAAILVTSVDRYLRNIDYNWSKNPAAQPTDEEFAELKKLTGDVPFVSILKPDMSWKSVRSKHSKWGQQVTGNKGGRPKDNKPGYKKQRRRENRKLVHSMIWDKASLNEIKDVTGIPRTTLQDQRRKFIHFCCTVFCGTKLMNKRKTLK